MVYTFAYRHDLLLQKKESVLHDCFFLLSWCTVLEKYQDTLPNNISFEFYGCILNIPNGFIYVNTIYM